jgi:DNA-directed RNA polymerase subunit F
MSDREIHITVEVNSKPTLINKDELNEIYKYIEESVNKIQGPFVNLSWKVDTVNKLKALMLSGAYIKTSKTFDKESIKKVIDELISIMVEDRKEEYKREKGEF